MKNLDTLPQDIYSLLEKEEGHEVSEENIQSFLNTMEDLLRTRLAPKEKNRATLRFSSLGQPDRKLWYKHNTPEDGEKLTGKTLFKFLYGDVIEALLVFLTKESGHTVEDEQREVNVDGVLGHIDCKIDGVLVDIKSASPFGFKKFVTNSVVEDDPFGYVQQLSGYATELTPDEPAAWVAFDKVSAEICVSKLSSTIISSFKPKERIDHLRVVLDAPEPPERCYEDVADGKSGNRKLCTACSYCEFNKKCWPELRTFIYSNGPRFLTKTVRTPDVMEIIEGPISKPQVTN